MAGEENFNSGGTGRTSFLRMRLACSSRSAWRASRRTSRARCLCPPPSSSSSASASCTLPPSLNANTVDTALCMHAVFIKECSFVSSRPDRKQYQGHAQVKGIAHVPPRPLCQIHATGLVQHTIPPYQALCHGTDVMKACDLRSRYGMVMEVFSVTSPSLSGPGSSSEASSAAAAAAAAAAWRLRRPA